MFKKPPFWIVKYLIYLTYILWRRRFKPKSQFAHTVRWKPPTWSQIKNPSVTRQKLYHTVDFYLCQTSWKFTYFNRNLETSRNRNETPNDQLLSPNENRSSLVQFEVSKRTSPSPCFTIVKLQVDKCSWGKVVIYDQRALGPIIKKVFIQEMKNGAICMFLLYVEPCPEIAACQSEPIGFSTSRRSRHVWRRNQKISLWFFFIDFEYLKVKCGTTRWWFILNNLIRS